MSADFKKMFGDNNAWFMSDPDYITSHYKLNWFIKCGKGTIGVILCEDRREKYNLDYENCYWGSDDFHALLNKYNLEMEWENNCIASISYQ